MNKRMRREKNNEISLYRKMKETRQLKDNIVQVKKGMNMTRLLRRIFQTNFRQKAQQLKPYKKKDSIQKGELGHKVKGY